MPPVRQGRTQSVGQDQGVSRIGGIAGPAANAARRGGRAAGGFVLPGPGVPQAAAAPAPAAGISALLAMQEDAARERPDRDKPARRAARALDELRGLQLDLLRGAADPARLERLTALVEASGAAAEPALRPLLAEILLRTRVELARQRARMVPTFAR
jgi:hypothetical protein